MGGELVDRRPRQPMKKFCWDAEKLSRTGRGEAGRGWEWGELKFFYEMLNDERDLFVQHAFCVYSHLPNLYLSHSFIHYLIQHAYLILGRDIYYVTSTEFILLPSFLFNGHLLSTYCLSSTGLGPTDREMNKL